MDPRTSAQDVMRCDLCETAAVQMHCDTCLVNLCKGCVGEHISTEESKDHKVVKFQSRKSTPLYPECASHEKEKCEMYCRHCDIPVCQTCLASDQHLGHKLSKILHVLGEKKDLIRNEQSELNETIYPTYQDIAVDVQNRMSQLEKEYGDLSTAITKHGENWHREIENLVRKLKTQVDEMKNSQLQTLQKHLNEINKNIVAIKAEIDLLDIAADSNDISSPLNVRSNVDQYKNLPQKLVLSVPKFTPGTIQGEQLCKLFGTLSSISLTADDQGYSIKTTQRSPKDESSFVDQTSPEIGCRQRVKRLKKPMISEKCISCSGFLRSVACLRNEKFWTTMFSNTMTLYSFNQDSPLKQITTKSGNRPLDIAVTRNEDLVYTDYTDRSVNIVKNEKTKIEEVIRLENWKPQCVCSTSTGELLITMESDDKRQSKVVRYSGSAEKQSIQFDDKGTPLYSSNGSTKYISENRNFDICVADWGAKAVVVVNQAGKYRFRYKGYNLVPRRLPLSPKGITTDSQGHILISDGNHECVHIINEDGKFLSYIKCQSLPFLLRGLCTDTEDNLFLLSCKVSGKQSTTKPNNTVISSQDYVKKIEYLQ